jgi:hypothetical protein
MTGSQFVSCVIGTDSVTPPIVPTIPPIVPVVGSPTYYQDKAATLVGTSGYTGMTAAQIEAERRQESRNMFAVTVNANTNASASSIASSVIAAQKYGSAVIVGGYRINDR